MSDTTPRPAGYIELSQKVADLRARNICYQCHDLETGEVFGEQPVIADDEHIRVVLDMYGRAHGQTIVAWKPHREDFTELEPDETALLFTRCTEVANAIKRALGAEKVYLVTMCDGYPNHLHIQLLPRYPGEPVGSKRFVGPRQLLTNGEELADRIRRELSASLS